MMRPGDPRNGVDLTAPLEIGTATAPSRIFFGPHPTNLGRERSLTDGHRAYYERRARGGAGVVVVEAASVHRSDWPYERAPLAERCGPGWAAITEALAPSGTVVIAGLGHAGAQGTSAYSQSVLWGPSPVPQNNDREVPKVMEPADVAALVEGFGSAAGAAVGAGMAGVEVNAGQFSLLRQFLSGLTNQRTDEWGTDRGRLLAEVLEEVRSRIGGGILGLRLSCDEMAPWAGITPDHAAELADRFAPDVDYLVVERGSIYTVWATRPDGHVPPGFNLDLTRGIREVVDGRALVVAQGSIVDAAMAEEALDGGIADAVEMTRAQIADPDLAAKVSAGRGDRIRPCLLCNQRCMVRDARNPIVSCVVEPSAGHEAEDPDWTAPAAGAADVLVVGAGPAGLEAARVAALRGHRVTVRDRAEPAAAARVVATLPGMGRLEGFVAWLRAECEHAGVTFDLGREVTPAELEAPTGSVLLCTGSRPAPHGLPADPEAVILDGWEVLAALADGTALPEGPAAVWDPLGGPLAVGLAELLAPDRPVTLITPDLIVGKDLALSGDLAPANTRLQVAGVDLVTVFEVAAVEPGRVVLEHRYTGARREVEAGWVVSAGHRVPDLDLWEATGKRFPRVGDAVAPRTVAESVLEGRRAALAVEGR
jgi:2,4-dienoyl-CoA reductase (NADPH2)